jgi:multidrug efflux pump subunit AcrA (membrane-fusion protein)
MAAGDDLGIKPRAVWTFDGRRFTPIRVTVGLADDQRAELLKGSVRAGDHLVTRADVRRRSRFSSSP